MRTIEHSIHILAAPTAVWKVLSDTAAYPDWNPFLTRLDGRLTVGERLTVTIRPGARTMTFRPRLREVQPGRLIRWIGRLGVPGIFDGDHELRLEPTPDGGTRFTQREVFSGLTIPFMRAVLDDTDAGFAAMNTAMATRVHALRMTAEVDS